MRQAVKVTLIATALLPAASTAASGQLTSLTLRADSLVRYTEATSQLPAGGSFMLRHVVINIAETSRPGIDGLCETGVSGELNLVEVEQSCSGEGQLPPGDSAWVELEGRVTNAPGRVRWQTDLGTGEVEVLGGDRSHSREGKQVQVRIPMVVDIGPEVRNALVTPRDIYGIVAKIPREGEIVIFVPESVAQIMAPDHPYLSVRVDSDGAGYEVAACWVGSNGGGCHSVSEAQGRAIDLGADVYGVINQALSSQRRLVR